MTFRQVNHILRNHNDPELVLLPPNELEDFVDRMHKQLINIQWEAQIINGQRYIGVMIRRSFISEQQNLTGVIIHDKNKGWSIPNGN